MSKLLSILIPTYNRSAFLKPLLMLLETEVAGREHLIEIIVGDNASTDDTLDVTSASVARCSSIKTMRHPENVGPDENFCRCLEASSGAYVWIIGDDDLPIPGVIPNLLELLAKDNPDVVYLRSTWHQDILEAVGAAGNIATLNGRQCTRAEFAKKVNVWFTFISGIVFNYSRFRSVLGATEIRRFLGTNLVQLGWVFPILREGGHFLAVEQPCILATSGNTGGYAVIKTFCHNFVGIVIEMFGKGSEITRAILRRHSIQYLPGLIWNVRFGSSGKFIAEDRWQGIHPALRKAWVFWGLLMPILYFRKPFAFPFYLAARIVALFQRLIASSR